MNIVLILHKYGVPLDDPCCYPLGFMYISAVLKEHGHSVKVLNYNLWDYDIREELRGTDVAMFTGFEEFKPWIIKDAAICREMGIKTILGGALATFCSKEMLAHVDTVVVGEGERVVEQALNSSGIVKGLKPDINNLPLPDYEGFGIDEYHRRHGVKYMGILTSRGCPHSCTFCAHTCAFQCRSLGKVGFEISRYKAFYGATNIIVNDNTLNSSKGHLREFCDEIAKYNVKWSAAMRLDNIDEDILDIAKASGLVYVVVGVESFKQFKLDLFKKKIASEQIVRGLDLLHKLDIKYHGNLLVGLPGESLEDIEKEIAAIPPHYNIFPMPVQPFVGTAYKSRSISQEDYKALQARCKAYAESKQMHVYPEAA